MTTQIPFANPIDTSMLDSALASTTTPTPALKTTSVPTTTPTSTPSPSASTPQYNVMTGELLKPGETQPEYNNITGQKIGTNQYDPTKVTNPNGPSSSSTVTTNNNINTNTTDATNNANGVKPELSDLQNKIISTYGFDENYVRGLSSDAQAGFALQLRAEDVATKEADQAKADEQKMYSAKLAEQNAEYAQAKADLADRRTKDLDMAKATNAQLNPFGGGNTDSDNYSGAINTAYDKLDAQLFNSAQQAKAALDAGDVQAYASISNALAKMKTDGIANIQSMIADLKKTENQNNQFEKTFNQNEQIKNQTLADKELQTITGDSADKILGLPSDVTKLTPAQQATLSGTPGYAALIKSGLSPSDALGYIKNAATGNKQQAEETKLQLSAARAQAYLMNAQANLADKQSAAIDAGTVASSNGGVFLSAFQNAQASGKYTKDKNSTTLSTLAYNLGSGDTANAKTTLVNYALSGGSPTDVRMYQTMQGLPTIIASLKEKINALPKDQKQAFLTGTFQDIAQKFGQNPNPQLATLVAEFGHLQKNYVAPIYGMRAAAGSSDSIFNNLFPSGSDANSLSLSKLDALVNTAQDSVNSQVQARIGTEPYQAIFGSAGALNVNHTVNTPGTWQGLTVGQDMVNSKDGKTYTITATGPVLKK